MKLKQCPACEVYTLEEKCPKCKKLVKDAHYKFIKVRDAPKSDVKFVRKH